MNARIPNQSLPSQTLTTVFTSGNSQAVRLPKEFRFSSKQLTVERRGDEVAQLEKLLPCLPVLPLSPESCMQDSRTRSDLHRKGSLIGPNDLWIAAHALTHALTHKLTLVTHHTREFARVKGLTLESWANT